MSNRQPDINKNESIRTSKSSSGAAAGIRPPDSHNIAVRRDEPKPPGEDSDEFASIMTDDCITSYVDLRRHHVSSSREKTKKSSTTLLAEKAKWNERSSGQRRRTKNIQTVARDDTTMPGVAAPTIGSVRGVRPSASNTIRTSDDVSLSVRPGAVRVDPYNNSVARIRRGMEGSSRRQQQQQVSDVSTFADDNIVTGPQAGLAVVAAEVVPEQVDLEARVQMIETEMRQRLAFGQDPVRADVIEEQQQEEREEPPQQQEEPPKPPDNRWKLWIGIVALLSVGVAIGVGVGVALSGDKASVPSSADANSTPSPTSDPPRSPTDAPADSRDPTDSPTFIPASRFEVISERLAHVSGESLSNESSAQFRALQWLVYDDPVMLPESSTPLNTLVERYVLVLLYFTTGGGQNYFLTNASVCEWNFIPWGCPGNPYPPIEDKRNRTTRSMDPFTCHQRKKGAFCDANETVIEIKLPESGLRGSIPTELVNLEFLEYLNLRGNSLTGTLPGTIGNHQILGYFDVSDNLLSGPIPESFGNFPRLLYLHLENNTLTGPIPSGIHQLPSLQTLYLSDNGLSGTIPGYERASKLSRAYYTNNNLTGEIPFDIAQLTSLFSVSFTNNSLTGKVPLLLGGMEWLNEFYAHGNQLTGDIEMFLLGTRYSTKWRWFDISQNQLSGTIPTIIGDITTLRHLNFGSNQIAGSLPTELGRLSLLQDLKLGSNQIIGTIPTELGLLTRLTSLDVGRNFELTGTLPSELGNLTDIANADFSNTMIGGTIPTELQVWMGGIDNLWLHGTNIVGGLDSVNCNSTSHVFENFVADCFDEVVCYCCTECYMEGNETLLVPNNF